MQDEFEVLEDAIIEEQPKKRKSKPKLTPEQTLVQTHYGQLPDFIQQELAEFVANYDYRRVKWNLFAVQFNTLLRNQLVRLLQGGDPNSLFFDIPTLAHDCEDYWRQCRETVIGMYPAIDYENLTISNYSKAAQKVVMDGFEFAHYVNLQQKDSN